MSIVELLRKQGIELDRPIGAIRQPRMEMKPSFMRAYAGQLSENELVKDTREQAYREAEAIIASNQEALKEAYQMGGEVAWKRALKDIGIPAENVGYIKGITELLPNIEKFKKPHMWFDSSLPGIKTRLGTTPLELAKAIPDEKKNRLFKDEYKSEKGNVRKVNSWGQTMLADFTQYVPGERPPRPNEPLKPGGNFVVNLNSFTGEGTDVHGYIAHETIRKKEGLSVNLPKVPPHHRQKTEVLAAAFGKQGEIPQHVTPMPVFKVSNLSKPYITQIPRPQEKADEEDVFDPTHGRGVKVTEEPHALVPHQPHKQPYEPAVPMPQPDAEELQRRQEEVDRKTQAVFAEAAETIRKLNEEQRKKVDEIELARKGLALPPLAAQPKAGQPEVTIPEVEAPKVTIPEVEQPKVLIPAPTGIEDVPAFEPPGKQKALEEIAKKLPTVLHKDIAEKMDVIEGEIANELELLPHELSLVRKFPYPDTEMRTSLKPQAAKELDKKRILYYQKVNAAKEALIKSEQDRLAKEAEQKKKDQEEEAQRARAKETPLKKRKTSTSKGKSKSPRVSPKPPDAQVLKTPKKERKSPSPGKPTGDK